MQIKQIHTFGTSHTEGGGFEFDDKPELIDLYKDCGEELVKSNFSWPHQLHKLIGVPVINHSKSGYGDERMYRKFFEVLANSTEEELKSKLFIFEFSQMGRKEYYCNAIDSHVINNYWGIDKSGNAFHDFNQYDPETLHISVTNDYNNHNNLLTNDIRDTYSDFFKKTYNPSILHQKVSKDAIMFLITLRELNINFITISRPFFTEEHFSRFILNGIIENELTLGGELNLVSFIIDNKLTITDETNGKHKDGHAGLEGNRVIADIIYKHIVRKIQFKYI